MDDLKKEVPIVSKTFSSYLCVNVLVELLLNFSFSPVNVNLCQVSIYIYVCMYKIYVCVNWLRMI